MERKKHDLLIIGAGPGGYVAAIRGAQLGLDVACVEAEPQLGGTCLRVGCVPSKALLESSHIYHRTVTGLAEHGITTSDTAVDIATMMARKEKVVSDLSQGISALFKRGGITRYTGTATFAAPHLVSVKGPTEELEIEAERIIIATGSRSGTLPGVESDGDLIGGSTKALSYPEPPEHLVVIGAGAIGLELGSVWRRLGSKVTVLEYLNRILPGVDAEVAREVQRLLKRQGIKFLLGARVTAARLMNGKPMVELEGGDPIPCDRVLVATGRKPRTDGLGLDVIDLKTDPQGRIPVDGKFETAVAGVYAIGDVIAGPMLAHKAEEEGVACVETIAGLRGHVNYDAIPAVVYTDPEVATVGRSEEDLKEAGVEYRKGTFFFRGNSRAKATGHIDGRVKILADGDGKVLGVHIVGGAAGEMIAQATQAMELGAGVKEIARTCHAHPTLSEAVKEAALAVEGRAIHG